MLILGISGKKQSGKSTVGNFILSLFLAKLDYASKIYMDEDGQLLVSDLCGDSKFEGVFNIDQLLMNHNEPKLHEAIAALNSKVKIYSFADILKKDICINILGLSYEQCYGDDLAKNTMTSIHWEDVPGYNETMHNSTEICMTARQVMQFVGTDIFRKMDPNVWVRATMNKIIRDKPELAVITDCRFPNEVEAIKKIDGKVLRLTRSPFDSSHVSENILDKNNYDWNNFDYIIDNANLTLLEQFSEIQKLLSEILPL